MDSLALCASLFFDQLPKMHVDVLTLHAIAWPGIVSATVAVAGFILAWCKWASESKADEARRNLEDEKDEQRRNLEDKKNEQRRNLEDEKDEQRRKWASNNFKNLTDDLNQARADLQNVTDRLKLAEGKITGQQEFIEQLQRDRSYHDIRMNRHSTALSLAEDRIKGLRENGGDHDKAIIDLEDTVKELKDKIEAPGSLGQASVAKYRIPDWIRQNSAAGRVPAAQRWSRPGWHPP
ncbi:hypothetical protein OEA41_003796 [Lepraria neglecta]|uniref:Uncharacterized protein n=1 Tax=Lepraria neglecta TaxID=209136 RepID=A0AAD9Z8G8_9LECA|nr:hypothetical protein OEA41_003796 [Lepraria neglecta]